MTVLSSKEKKQSSNTKAFEQPSTTRSGLLKKGRFTSGQPAHNRLNLSALIIRAESVSILGLELFPQTLRREGNGYFMVQTKCLHCGTVREKELRNLEKGFSSKCQCQHPSKVQNQYPGISPAVVRSLAARYQAMKQRCEKDTHVSSHRYKGRGIKCLFESRQEFITWALEKWPGETFKRKDFDREDNDGHYEKGNLRLVSRTVNLLNMGNTPAVNIGHARELMSRYPEIRYTERTVLGLLRCGISETAILERHGKSQKAGRRKSAPTIS
jgi:hypothetical protein